LIIYSALRSKATPVSDSSSQKKFHQKHSNNCCEEEFFYSKSGAGIREEETEICEQKGRGDRWWVLLEKQNKALISPLCPPYVS
tara:strand:+ start:207 stop:458 length:252 start_codon:yes stop_codon:yes gene_type:complete